MRFNKFQLLLFLPLIITMLYPVTFIGSLWISFGSFRVVFFEGIFVYIILIMLFLSLLKKKWHIDNTILNSMIFIFVVVLSLSVSLPLSTDKGQGIRLIMQTLYMFSFVFFVYIISVNGMYNRTKVNFTNVFILFSLWSLFLLLTGLGFNNYGEDQDYYFFYTIYGKHGAFLCSIIVAFYLLKLIIENNISKFEFVLFLFNFIILFMTGSRTAIVSFGLAFILTCVLSGKFGFKILSLLTLGLLIVAFLLPYLPIKNHYVINGEVNVSWSGRLPFWIKAYDQWLESGHILFGQGQGFTRAWILENQNTDVVTIGSLHNELLRILIESGVVGLTIYIGFIFFLIYTLYFQYLRINSYIHLVAIYALIQFIIASFPELVTQLHLVYGQYVFFLTGMAFANYKIRRKLCLKKI